MSETGGCVELTETAAAVALATPKLFPDVASNEQFEVTRTSLF